jgi:hypothetical protein
MRFLTSPVELIGENGRVVQVKVERNELVVDKNGSLRARALASTILLKQGWCYGRSGIVGCRCPECRFRKGRSLFRMSTVGLFVHVMMRSFWASMWWVGQSVVRLA